MKWLALALAAVVLAASCRSDVAARVGSTSLTVTHLDRELTAMRGNPEYVAVLDRVAGGNVFADRKFIPSLVAQVLTVEVTAGIVHEELLRRGIKITADDRQVGHDEATAAIKDRATFTVFPQWYQEELLRRSLERVALRRTLVQGMTPETYYAERKDEFLSVCSSDIVVATRVQADQARRRIAAGESFASVAQQVSIDKGTAQKGGDLGCNGRNDLRLELNKVALAQPIGVVSDPITTSMGVHLLLVEKRYIRPLSLIRNQVEGSVLTLGRTRLDELVAQRLRSTRVVISRDFGKWNGKVVVPR